jgi:ABC-type transport system involved in multi-copper enzyme maturation permease subunit
MGLLRAELLKLARHPLLRGLVLALLGLVVLRGVVWPPDPDLPWHGMWSVSLITAALIMLSAVSMGQEFSDDTFRSLASRGVPRWALLLPKFAALVLVGGGLLGVTEGLAVLFGIRSALPIAELGRAWLSLWPYVALVLSLTVVARNGGLALVVGVMLLALEQFLAMLLGSFATLPEIPGWEWITHRGLLGTLYQWSLSYNASNWTYLATWQRAPMPMNAFLQAMPHPARFSAVVLAAVTLLGLGLSLLVIYRRDLTEVVEGGRGRLRLVSRRDRHGKGPVDPRRARLPSGTGKGPVLVRLARAHLYRTGRTPLVRVGLLVSLLFPLTLWVTIRSLGATGFEDQFFGSGSEAGVPLMASIGLLLVGPLATIVAVLAIGNELSLGTRRAELTRGITRTHAILSQSLALILIVGAMFGAAMAIVLLISASTAGIWPVESLVQSVLVATLATGAYVGATQIGGALFQSPLGATLFGLGFLVIDWVAIMAPTVSMGHPGLLLDVSRYSVFANTYGLANQGPAVAIDFGWQYSGGLEAVLVLLGYALASHALAALIANWRDA